MTKRKKAGNILVYALMAALIAGLGGFGITNFAGGGTSIATVGDRDITAEDYYRALVQAMRAQEASGAADASFAAMEAAGIPAQVRGQLLGTAALDNETAQLGLSVGDEEVARMITTSSAFQGVDGSFDRETYEYMLDRNGWGVSEFEQSVREESARNILQASVSAGVAAPAGLVNVLTDWFGERRSFRWVRFDRSDLAGESPEPTEQDLSSFHADNKAAFRLPEMKRITYALLTPDMLAGQDEVEEDAVQALYAERADRYIVPERRLVERLVFGTADEASAAKAAIDAGETDFKAVVESRDLTLEDVDLGEVTKQDLSQAGEAVFSLEEPGIVGPYPTSLGPALFRMNGILSASETSFEQAEEELRAELGRDEARRTIEDMINDLDDRLAGGATVEDLASETDMELGAIDFWSGADEDIAGYMGFREAAAAVTEKDFPQIITLDDGSVFAMRLDEIVPPRLQTLDEVRGEVTAAWEAAQAVEMLRETAEAARAQLDVGGKLGDGGEQVHEEVSVTRTAFLEQGVPQLADTVFGLEPGDSAVVEAGDSVLLVQLDTVAAPDAEDPQVALFKRAMTRQVSQGISSDLFLYFAQYLTSTAGRSINDAGINAVHSQIVQ